MYSNPKKSRSRYTLMVWVFGLLLIVICGSVALYGGSRIWMLDEDADLQLPITSPARTGFRTLDLLRPGIDYVLQVCCDDSTTVVDVAGRPARLFRVRPTDPLVKGNLRAELRTRPTMLGREIWYQGDIHVPEDWRPSGLHVIAMQWHGTHDLFLLEPGTTPPLMLSIIGDRWQLTKSWDQRLRSSPDDEDATTHGREVIGEAPLRPGQWVRWTFQVRWATGEAGMVRAWRDGQLVVDDVGPNANRDLIGPYLKAGVYVPDWLKLGPEPGIAERQLHFAALQIAAGADPFGLLENTIGGTPGPPE